ncbi:NB-ARC domain-containing protein [Reticulomyxa filosa]|uniref:NB-ARC domain-containing protein n=1 Tax=Reticulomyxa filosa TaxID=46433 RepID=X6PCW8_RETFI|nr:NB-ARC domain-containing protein [Reticulomyxa filosa]|eukprot:ETO36350.1 NB-ARC domain-containing protein [Reticulomyxa filosa]
MKIQENDEKGKNEQTEQKLDKLEKEREEAEVGEIRPGINLQGYCTNKQGCLASDKKIPVWINQEFKDITFTSDEMSYHCSVCGSSTITLIIKVTFFNSEHSICASDTNKLVKDNHYQCTYPIRPGIYYELKATKIRQHANNIDDLINRSEDAMKSIEIEKLVKELEKYSITVVKPSKVKDKERLIEKIQCDYNGDYNRVFDVGRFTILCGDAAKLQTAVEVMKKAEQFGLVVSEDKNFFDKLSQTHHRFHNIKLYVPNIDIYVEMQATLKNFTTLEGYTVIENPKLSHLFYELIRVWIPDHFEEELKRASDEALTKINDIICEWIDAKEIRKIAIRFKPHSEIRILKPPQLKEAIDGGVDSKKDISLRLFQFVYDQLCKFNPVTMKGQAIYVILFEYFKKHIIGEMNPASCTDVVSILKESRKQELEEDIPMLQALETYIPLEANNYPYDNNSNRKEGAYDCQQFILNLLEEKKNDQDKQQITILQGKSGSGKSLFCRYLEEILWTFFVNGSTMLVPVYISLPKCYNELNEKQIISQALQMKQINKNIIDAIRENMSFVFILDGFDEIFDKYNKNDNDKRYFYDRFNLNEWSAKIIEQMNGYIDKFVKMNKKNKMNNNLDWTIQQYEETLNNYPHLHKMMEEPFLLRMILAVLPSLMKQHSIGTKISKAQVYEAFNEQWIDMHVKNISNKLSELRIQTNIKKIKLAFQQYCQDLAFEMFIQGRHVATEDDINMQLENEEIKNTADPELDLKNKSNAMKSIETKTDEAETSATKKKGIWEKYFNSNNIVKYMSKIGRDRNYQSVNENVNASIVKTKNIWDKYFKGDSIAKYILRRVGENKYQFLHKSCQEYYSAQKMIFDIISWKPVVDTTVDFNNQQFQQQFETHVEKLDINCKLLNEELGIIQFIADRIHETKSIFEDLKLRLFRIIEASKNNPNVSVAAANAATILNVARVGMSYQNWDKVNISHAILDRAFLEGTSFKEAILDHVSFFRAFLYQTNFTSATVNQINFGEYGYLIGHSDTVTCVKFSPDGSRLASCSDDKTIRLWDTSSGKQLQLLEGHLNSVTAIDFSSDGSKIVSGSKDKSVRLWDALSGKHTYSFEGHSGCITSVQFSPDGSRIVSGSFDKTIKLWDVVSGKQLQTLNGHSDSITSVHLSSDGNKIVSGSKDKSIRLWDVSSGKQIQCLEGHSNIVECVRFSPDNLRIVSSSWDKTIKLWDVSSGKHLQSFSGHFDHVSTVQFSPDGSKIVSGSWDKTIRLWDVLSGKQLQLLEGHLSGITSIQFSPDGSRIVSSSLGTYVRLWDASSGKQLLSFEGHSDVVGCAQFSPDGSRIASGSNDKTIKLWDASSGNCLQSLTGHSDYISSVKFSLDGFRIVSGSWDKTVRLWDASSGKQVQIFEGHLRGVTFAHFSPDGSKIVSSSFDTTIKLWNVLSGELIQSFEGHLDYVTSVQFSPDGSRIVSGSFDKTIKLWDTLSGKILLSLNGHTASITSVQFSSDGSKIVSGSKDKSIRLWDALSGKQLQSLEGHSDYVTCVEISFDGSSIVSGSEDKTIRVWDVSSGKQLQCLEGHSKWITSVQFSHDNSKIVSSSNDNTIRLWALSSSRSKHLLEFSTNVDTHRLSPNNKQSNSNFQDELLLCLSIFHRLRNSEFFDVRYCSKCAEKTKNHFKQLQLLLNHQKSLFTPNFIQLTCLFKICEGKILFCFFCYQMQVSQKKLLKTILKYINNFKSNYKILIILLEK